MKRILTMLLAAVMLLTTAMPTLALSDFAPQPDAEVFSYPDPVPDAAVYSGCDIDIVNTMATYIDLDVFEQWAYEVFRNCPTGYQYFSSTTYSTLGSQLVNKLPSSYSDYIKDYVWYWCPRLFQCFVGCTVSTSGGYVNGFYFSSYKYDAATYQSMMAAVEANIHYFTDGLTGNGLTDLQKIVILHDRIVNWTEYDYDGYEEKYVNNNPDGMDWSSYTMYGTIVRRDSVCQGISLAQLYIGKKLGLNICYCHSSKINHAWNIVILNGQRYYLDTTWDDPVADFLGKTKHTYLLCSKNTFGHDSTTHSSKIASEDVIDYERTCTDTTYDSAFWKSMSYSSFQLVNNEYVSNGIYYVNPSGKLMKWTDANDLTGANNTVIYNIGYSYSGVATDGERLFFSAGRTVYEWDFATETAIPLWTLPSTLSTSYKIYGIQYDNRAAGTGREVSSGVYSGSKLWVKASSGSTSASNATQFDNVYEVDLSGTLQSYTTTVTNGTATPAVALAGETVTIKANTAPDGMIFNGWTVDEGSTAVTLSSASSSQTTFAMPNGNVQVTANYKVKPTTMPEVGYNYLVNGDFSVSNKTDSGFGWKTDRASVTVTDGVASVVNGNETRKGLYERIAFVAGHSYTITGTVADLSGDLKLYLDDTSDNNYVKTLSNGNFTYTFTATADMDRILFGGWKSEYKLSNITLTDNTGGGGESSTPSSSASQETTTTTQAAQSSSAGSTVTGNLIVNGDFSNGTTGWTLSSTSVASVVNGQLIISGNPSKDFQAKASFTTVVGGGKTYTLRFEMPSTSGVTVKVRNKTGDGSGSRQTYTAGGTYTFTTDSSMASDSSDSSTLFMVYVSGPKYTDISAVLDNFVMVEGTSIPETSETTQSSETSTSSTPTTTYTVTANNGTADKTSVEAGETVTLTAGTPAAGYTFDKWTSSDVTFANANNASTTFTMPSKNVTVTATFKKISYTVSVSNGSASSSTASVGDTVTVTANAATSGMVFDKWVVKSGSTAVSFTSATSTSTTFTMPAGNVSVEATYKAQSYTISVTGGTANKATATAGETVTLTPGAAPAGKVFSGWSVTPSSVVIASNSFTMPASNVTVTATYEDEQGESDIAAPTNLQATATATGITVSWNAVSGATGYRVYKKVNGSWETVKTIKDGTATSLAVSNLDAGVAYTFTVQAFVTDGGETSWGNYDVTGVTATATFGAPDVGTVTKSGLGIQVTWVKVTGASGYRVYRRTVENQTLGSWKTIATVSNNSTVSYTDNNVIVGAEYAYTVQAYTGSGSSLKWSTYDPVGMRGSVSLSAPILGNASKVTSGATVSWNAVEGATGYRIYRWNGSAWKTVKTVLGTSVASYTDTNSKAVAGAKYTVQAFHVRDGVVSWSEPNTVGVTVAGGGSTPTVLGSEDIDLVSLTYFDDACTEYGVSFHSFAALTSPKIQVVQGTATSAADFASAREIAVTDNYTKTINEFDNYSKTTYEFDYVWSNRSSMVQSITTYIHQGVIDNLSFNTTYSYRVGDSSSNVWSGIYTFTTRASTISDFSMIYTADTQPENSEVKGYKGVSTILQKALQTAPDSAFFVSGGDFVYCSDDGMSAISMWRNMLNGANNLMGSDAYFAEHPWFVANGNHDNNYVQYFFNNDTTSTSNDYYSYDYGDVHFIVLDSGHNGSLDTTQLSWLQTDLAATTKKFKVVFIHWPFYCHEERDLSGTGRTTALALFDQYDVDFVISAHVNEDYYTTYPINNGAVDTAAVSGATVQNGVTYYNDPTGPIYLQNAGSGMNEELTSGGEKGVMYVGKKDGGLTCSYPDLMMHTTMAGYESSYLVLKVEGNKLSINRYYLDASLQSQLYTVGQVGVIKN